MPTLNHYQHRAADLRLNGREGHAPVSSIWRDESHLRNPTQLPSPHTHPEDQILMPSVDAEGTPRNSLLGENGRQNPGRSLLRQPQRARQNVCDRNRFETQQIEARMSTRDVHHGGDGEPKIRERNVLPQFKQAQYRLFLFEGAQLGKRTR